MSDKKVPAQDKLRGIIVVDTNALMALSYTLPDLFKTESSAENPDMHKLFQGLYYLSHNGFKIVIPEMVAWEAYRYLRNGKTTADYYSGESIRHEFAKCRYFFQGLKTEWRNGANITIEPPQKSDSSKASLFFK